MPTATQTLDAGESVLAKYERMFNARRGFEKKPFDKLLILLAGSRGVGKSTFVESSPNILRLDLDRAGTSNPVSKCLNVPVAGQPPIDWEWTKNTIQTVIETEKTKPTPGLMLCIDTVDMMMMQAIKAWEKKDGKPIAETDSRRSYGWVYDQVAGLIHQIHMANIGCVLITHIEERKKAVGLDKEGQPIEIFTPALSLSEKLVGRFVNFVDLSCIIENKTIFKPRVVPQMRANGGPVKDSKGRPMMLITGTDRIHTRVLQLSLGDNIQDASLRMVVKKRVPLDETIELPSITRDNMDDPSGIVFLENEYNMAVEKGFSDEPVATVAVPDAE